ncbi:MAG: glucose 1-dehydrogenase [Alphaproteobacteria bacterium]|nr:glucose 1-dehydrogenase [Alphaproteobacteria bacterium]
MKRLTGKRAVITGGAVGIGEACARRMAQEGAQIAILDILDVEGRRLAAEIVREGASAIYISCDVRSERQVSDAMTSAAKAMGGLDVLVNNAGISGSRRPTHELTEEEWDLVQAVNVKGVFFCTKHAISHMKSARGGSIINLSSIYGLVGAADVPAYHASKGAVRLMTKTDAMLYAADGIRVNSIHPGFIETDMVRKFLNDQPDPAAARAGASALHPLGRIGVPDDIAWGCVYLASDESGFVTGSELVIDGGYTAR